MKKTLPNWYVITGGPCSGKTTLVENLQQNGHQVIFEAARILIDQEIKKDRTLSEIRKNEALFQDKVLQIKLDTESKLPRNKTIFFDRGIPDTTAYYNLIGHKPKRHFLQRIKKAIYKKIFLLDLLPFEPDYARTETKRQTKRVHQMLKEAYQSLNLPIVTVPVLPVEQRAAYITEHL